MRKISYKVLMIGLVITSITLAAQEPSWKHEEEMIKQHLASLSEQQKELSQELNLLNAQLSENEKSIDDLKSSLALLQDSQDQHKEVLAKQLKQALKWQLKNQVNDSGHQASYDHSVKSHLLEKMLHQQKERLKEQFDLIRDFDTQISYYLQNQQHLRSEIAQREVFFSQLMQNDQQLKSFLDLCLQEQQKEIASLSAPLGSALQAVLANEPFRPHSLAVPLPLFSGRHQKDFFGATVISGREGEPITAVGPGKVIFSDQMKGLGRVIMVEHEKGYLSLYGNCGEIYKKVGEEVATGEQIATVGQSGQLGVSALYFEFRHESDLIPPQWDQERG